MSSIQEPPPTSRNDLLQRGIALESVVIVWNVAEGVIAVVAGLMAGSVALVGFGVDSTIEVTSAVVVWWRLRHERRGDLDEQQVERLEHRTGRVAGALLFILAGYLLIDGGRRLLGYGPEAAESLLGIVLTALSLIAMPILGRLKLRIAGELGSRALRADAFETIACAWLSLATLTGLALNAAFGWAWADPAAALAIVPLLIREGREAWSGEPYGHCPS